ncbi:hypothetical protein NDU88_002628 [Pleurodeles waltl]|uniref:Uncharacterized protein n=1 Tax=Pleurodeles waltl TaxID=8319 RepID=A0AAV7TL28_PLEWA|nr:hypothetical protein NDU88_002628 [Pleurodeles waltl]
MRKEIREPTRAGVAQCGESCEAIVAEGEDVQGVGEEQEDTLRIDTVEQEPEKSREPEDSQELEPTTGKPSGCKGEDTVVPNAKASEAKKSMTMRKWLKIHINVLQEKETWAQTSTPLTGYIEYLCPVTKVNFMDALGMAFPFI